MVCKCILTEMQLAQQTEVLVGSCTTIRVNMPSANQLFWGFSAWKIRVVSWPDGCAVTMALGLSWSRGSSHLNLVFLVFLRPTYIQEYQELKPLKQIHQNAVWKRHDFSVTQILWKIHLGDSRSSKNAFLTFMGWILSIC